jgi:hypothetical protein
MWKAAGHGDVDGVLLVDAIGLQAIVQATGPVPAGGRTLAAKDIPKYVLHDQYRQFSYGNGGRDIDNAARKESIGGLAKAAVHAIDAGDYRPSTLVRTLGDAVVGRHLLAWTSDATESAGWSAAGMGGELGPDSLLVSLLNTGSNKLDWFLDVGATLGVERSAAGWDVTVELSLTNATPEGEPRYIAGPFPGSDFEPRQYQAILAVNVPGAAQRSRFDGVPSLAVAGPDGPTRVVGFLLSLSAGESRRVVLRFSLPSTADHVVIEPSARVPQIRWQHGSSSWKDRSPRSVNLRQN